MNKEIASKLKSRYDHLPPLLIHRSIERANTDTELFDILDTVPSVYPIVWNNDLRRWTNLATSFGGTFDESF